MHTIVTQETGSESCNIFMWWYISKAEKQKSLFSKISSPSTFYKIQYIYAAPGAWEQFHDLIFGNAYGRAIAFC